MNPPPPEHDDEQPHIIARLNSRLQSILKLSIVQAGLISLAIFLSLVFFNWQADNQKIQETASLGEIVDIAGRQRMLSQRIAKNLLILKKGADQSNAYAQLDADLETLNHHQQILTETASLYEIPETPDEASPRALLHQISPLIATISQSVSEVLMGQQTAVAALPSVLASEQRLIPLLNQFNTTLTAEKNLQNSSYQKHHLIRESRFLFALIFILFCAIWYFLAQIQQGQSKLKREKQRLLKLTRVMKDKQQKLSAAISASFHETWSWTQSTGEFWCSESFWKTFGYQSVSEYPNATFEAFRAHIDSENRGLLETAIQEHLAHGTPIHMELSARTEQGTYRWVRIQGKMILDESKNREFLAGTVEDIHDHRLAKLQLDQKEKLLKKVGKVGKIGGWHIDLKMNELFWTAETCAIHEVDPDYRPTIESGINFYAPEARPIIEKAVKHTIETGEPWDLKLPLITAKGRHIWVRAQGELEYENNKPVRIVGAFQDISTEKQHEINFLMMQDDKFRSHARLESVISAATEVSIVATDPEGLITLFSPGAERLLGYSAEEIIGIERLESFHLAAEVEQRGRELTESLGRTVKNFEAFVTPAMLGGFDQREWTYVCKDGMHRTVALTVTAIRDQQNQIEGFLGVAIDITQKKQDEKQLARLAAAVSKSTNGVVITDELGQVEWVNDGFIRMSGYELEELLGKTPGSVLQGEQTDSDTIEKIRQKINQGASFETEIINYRKSGEEYWVQIKADPIHDSEGRLTGFMAIESDITLRKQAEQQLQKSGDQIRHLMDCLPVAAYTCDPEGMITYFNQAAVELWEREPLLNDPNERFCGSFKIFDTEGNFIPDQECCMALAIREQKNFHGKQVLIECINGRRKSALAHVSPTYNLEGEFTGAINVLVDNSDQKALEKSLREATTRLELCLKVLDQHAIVAETELNGSIRHVNEMFCHLTGFEKHEAIGKTHRIVNSGTHSKEFWKNVFGTIAETGMWQGEICNRKKNGELYWVDTTIAAMKDGEGISTGYLAIRNDITELKLAQEAALAASHSKSQFLANMSHEIRTPLTAILGYAELLKDDSAFTSSLEKREQAVNTILNAGNHLLTVINDILDLSKIEAGKMGLEKTPTHVFKTLEQIESFLRPRALGKGVQLSSKIENSVPDVIESDPTRLRQILMNLVGNAVKFTEQGNIKIIVRRVEQDHQKSIQFDIEDSGSGMSPQQAEKIFKAFSQADTSVTRQHGGTGLGLVISRKLARLMGGEVSLVWTKRGTGTCFRFEMPERSLPQTRYLTSPSLANPEVSSKKTTTAGYQLPEKTRVLLAEDGPDNQRLISFLLKKMGALVDVADNGAIAYQNYLEAEKTGQPYHLLLTDIQMPEMDGHSLTKELRAEGATLPIIALTAHAMAEDRQKCLDAGCDDYLSKPIDRLLLAQTIEKWMAHASKTPKPPAVS